MKRAAIIGCGTIFQVHLPIIVANPEIELCAVCDNNPAVQEKLPAAAKAVPFYTDYEELLEKEHPDVVHLCLPHYLHVPVSEYFASHGVNVFCEKPVGLNTAQAKEFVEFEAAHPEVKIGICLQNRLNRTTVELKKIIDGGEYGKVIGYLRCRTALCGCPLRRCHNAVSVRNDARATLVRKEQQPHRKSQNNKHHI